jgi:general L-amino acid transport system permease protein
LTAATVETLPPPRTTIGPVAWLRHNLFSSWANAVITLVILVALAWLLLQVGQWAMGARWSVVTNNLRVFLIGLYPAEHAWRLWLTLTILSVLSGLSAPIFGRTTRAFAITLSAIQLILAGLMALSPLGPIPTLAVLLNAVLVWAGFFAGARLPRRMARRPLTIAWLISLPISFWLVSGYAGTPLV